MLQVSYLVPVLIVCISNFVRRLKLSITFGCIGSCSGEKDSTPTSSFRPGKMGLCDKHFQCGLVFINLCGIPVPPLRTGHDPHHRLHELELLDCRRDSSISRTLLDFWRSISIYQRTKLRYGRQCCHHRWRCCRWAGSYQKKK